MRRVEGACAWDDAICVAAWRYGGVAHISEPPAEGASSPCSVSPGKDVRPARVGRVAPGPPESSS